MRASRDLSVSDNGIHCIECFGWRVFYCLGTLTVLIVVIVMVLTRMSSVATVVVCNDASRDNHLP